MRAQVNTENISTIIDENGVQRWRNEASLKHAYGDYLQQNNWTVDLDVETGFPGARIDILAKHGEQVQLINVNEGLDDLTVQKIIDRTFYYRRYNPDAQLIVAVGQLYAVDGGIEALSLLEKRGFTVCSFDPDVYYQTESVERNPLEWVQTAMLWLILVVLSIAIVAFFFILF